MRVDAAQRSWLLTVACSHSRPPPPQMRVDTARHEDLRLTFNLTFHALPCEALLMDSGDVSGKWQTESAMKVAR